VEFIKPPRQFITPRFPPRPQTPPPRESGTKRAAMGMLPQRLFKSPRATSRPERPEPSPTLGSWRQPVPKEDRLNPRVKRSKPSWIKESQSSGGSSSKKGNFGETRRSEAEVARLPGPTQNPDIHYKPKPTQAFGQSSGGSYSQKGNNGRSKVSETEGEAGPSSISKQ
jgi:hypothetical protein